MFSSVCQLMLNFGVPYRSLKMRWRLRSGITRRSSWPHNRNSVAGGQQQQLRLMRERFNTLVLQQQQQQQLQQPLVTCSSQSSAAYVIFTRVSV